MTTPVASRIEHLLLVDDDEVDQLLHRRVIERSKLVEHIHSFRMAREALDYLSQGGRADLILLDIRMPGMSGFEFLEAAIRELGSDFAPVVIMLTTSMDPRDRETAASYPVVKGYLEKPLHDETVLTLAEMLAPPQNSGHTDGIEPEL